MASLPLALALPFATRAQASLHRFVLEHIKREQRLQGAGSGRARGGVANRRGSGLSRQSGNSTDLSSDRPLESELPLPIGWQLPGRTTGRELMAELTSRLHLPDYAGAVQAPTSADEVVKAGLPYDWEAEDTADPDPSAPQPDKDSAGELERGDNSRRPSATAAQPTILPSEASSAPDG